MTLSSALFLFMSLFLLGLLLVRVLKPLYAGGLHSEGGLVKDLSDTPEWQSLAGRRQEIEQDPLLDEHAKQSLIQSWQEMAQSSRELLQRPSTQLVSLPFRLSPLAFAVFSLVAAAGLFLLIGGVHDKSTQWPALSVDRSAGPSSRLLATSGEHPGDGISLDSRLESLQARLDQNPNDIQGWVLLARTQAAMSHYSDSVASLNKALDLVPGHPGLLADIADMMAMSNNRQMQGKPLELVKQALANDPFHEKSLALAATAAEQAGDNALAQSYWQRLTQAQQMKAEQTKAPAIAEVILNVPQAAIQSASDQAVLFVFVKAQAGEGMPLAVARIPITQLQAGQVAIGIDQDNLIGGKQLQDLPADLHVQARLAMSGSVQVSDKDWLTSWQQTALGSGQPVQLELEKGSFVGAN